MEPRKPKLPIEVSFEPVSWPPGGKEDVRLMPGIRIHNPTGDRWQNISLAINSQYFFYCPEPLEAGGDAGVPPLAQHSVLVDQEAGVGDSFRITFGFERNAPGQ